MKEPRLRVRREPIPGECGTYAGVGTHNREGTPVCSDCRRAQAEYAAMRRFRTGYLRDLRRCPECGSVFAEHDCQSPGRNG